MNGNSEMRMIHGHRPLLVDGVPKTMTNDLDGIVGIVDGGNEKIPTGTKITYPDAVQILGTGGIILGFYERSRPTAICTLRMGAIVPEHALGYRAWFIGGAEGSKRSKEHDTSIYFPFPSD